MNSIWNGNQQPRTHSTATHWNSHNICTQFSRWN